MKISTVSLGSKFTGSSKRRVYTMCVLKATTQSNRLFYGYLRKFFLFQKDAFCVIVHAGII